MNQQPWEQRGGGRKLVLRYSRMMFLRLHIATWIVTELVKLGSVQILILCLTPSFFRDLQSTRSIPSLFPAGQELGLSSSLKAGIMVNSAFVSSTRHCARCVIGAQCGRNGCLWGWVSGGREDAWRGSRDLQGKGDCTQVSLGKTQATQSPRTQTPLPWVRAESALRALL